MENNDDGLTEEVAKAIARHRMKQGELGRAIQTFPEVAFEAAFQAVWNGPGDLDGAQRRRYRDDAKEAVRAMREYTAKP